MNYTPFIKLKFISFLLFIFQIDNSFLVCQFRAFHSHNNKLVLTLTNTAKHTQNKCKMERNLRGDGEGTLFYHASRPDISTSPPPAPAVLISWFCFISHRWLTNHYLVIDSVTSNLPDRIISTASPSIRLCWLTVDHFISKIINFISKWNLFSSGRLNFAVN